MSRWKNNKTKNVTRSASTNFNCSSLEFVDVCYTSLYYMWKARGNLEPTILNKMPPINSVPSHSDGVLAL